MPRIWASSMSQVPPADSKANIKSTQYFVGGPEKQLPAKGLGHLSEERQDQAGRWYNGPKTPIPQTPQKFKSQIIRTRMDNIKKCLKVTVNEF